MKTTRGTQFRVGLFVLAALLIGGAIAFVVGNQQNAFTSKTEYFAVFDDVGGLTTGSPVRVAGVAVGAVSEVTFNEQGNITVSFDIIEDAAAFVRGKPATKDTPALGSVATIGSKGLLGDRLIEISVGEPTLPPWDTSIPLPSSPGSGLIAQAERTLTEVEGTATNLRRATDPFSDQVFSNDLKITAQNLAKLSGMLANSDGAIQRLVNDPELGKDLAGAIKNFRGASAEITELSRAVKGITKEIQSGDGTANALIYGRDGAQAMENVREASAQLSGLLKDIREGDGTIHDLIYTDEADDLFANLNKASADLVHLTKEMREGRGTVGGLLSDPSIYEDIKRLIGDLERNDILRALVRYSIRRDEARERVDVKD